MARKKLKDMNLLDDFLFWALLSNQEYGAKAGQYMLEMILQRPVGEVTVHAQNAIPGADESIHGIRLDAYITGADTAQVKGDIYDLEPGQRIAAREELPFRARYYHTMISSWNLGSSEDYTALRRAYVIMITSFDPFDRGRMMYTVRNGCLEEPDLPYEDGAVTIFLYVNGDPKGLPEDLVQLVRYMKETNRINASNDRLSAIQDMVDRLKQNREVLKAEMRLDDIIRWERQEEREETEMRFADIIKQERQEEREETEKRFADIIKQERQEEREAVEKEVMLRLADSQKQLKQAQEEIRELKDKLARLEALNK